MTLIQPLKNPQTLRWLLFAAFILLLLSLPALAQQSQGGGTSNPLSGINIAGGDNKNLNSMFGFFIKLIVVAAPFVIMIFVFGDAILSIFYRAAPGIARRQYRLFLLHPAADPDRYRRGAVGRLLHV